MCGLGQFLLAATLSILTLFTLIVLERVEDRYFPDLDPDASDQSAAAARLKGDTDRTPPGRKPPTDA
jgi:hypothetical protein